MTLISRTLWQGMIEQNLFDDNAIKAIKMGLRDDSAFINATTVAIPQAGAAAQVTKGNNTYPVSIGQRTDTVNTYDLTNLEVGPVLVQYKEKMPISYNKVESILQDQLSGIGLRAAREILLGQYHFTTGQYQVTTGDAAAGHAPSATGNRKALTFADLRNAMAKLANQDFGDRNDYHLFVDATMYYQLLADFQFNTNRDSVAGGIGFQLPGMPGLSVHQLTNVLFAQANGTVRAIGHAGGTTDQAIALLVSKSATSFALDSVQAMAEMRADYFGEIYSATTWLGGKYRRTDKKGIIPIIQANA